MKYDMYDSCCSVRGCPNTAENTKNIRFYRFSTRDSLQDRMKTWIKFCSRETDDGKPWQPTKSSLICSQHFVGNQKSENPKCVNYNPTIYSPSSERMESPQVKTEVLDKEKREGPLPVVVMDPKCICLVCGANEIISVDMIRKISSVGVVELFRTFAKHMEWDVEENEEFKFDEEAFPFCENCHLDLVKIYNLNEDARMVLSNLKRAVATVSAKLVLSVQQPTTKVGYSYNSNDPSQDLLSLSENPCPYNVGKVQFYRRMTARHFNPSVSLRMPMPASVEKEAERDQSDLQLNNYAVSNPGNIYACKIKIEPEESYLNTGASATSPLLKSLNENGDSVWESAYAILPDFDNGTGGRKPGAQCAMKRTFKSMSKSRQSNKRVVAKNMFRPSQTAQLFPSQKTENINQNNSVPETLILDSCVCFNCNLKFSSRKTLRNHITSGCKGFGRARRISTEFVKQISEREFIYRGFKFEEISDGKFMCCVCGLSYNSKNNTSTHILKKHARQSMQAKISCLPEPQNKNLSTTRSLMPYSSHSHSSALLQKAKSVGGKRRIRRYGKMHRMLQISENVFSYRGIMLEKLENELFKCSLCDYSSNISNYVTNHILRMHLLKNSKNTNEEVKNDVHCSQTQFPQTGMLIPGYSLAAQPSLTAGAAADSPSHAAGASSNLVLLNNISFLVPKPSYSNDQIEEDKRSNCSETILGHLTSDEEEQDFDGLVNSHVMVYDSNTNQPNSDWPV